MINRSQLKFHETFQPELNYISKIMGYAANGLEGDKFLISEQTGIPTGKQKGKVEPTIKYAKFMGLLDFTVDRGIYKLSLTDLGKEVFVQDRYLHENLTKWLCHCEITSNYSGAAQWAFLIHQAHEGFANEIAQEWLLSHANKEFRVNMGFEELFGVVKRSYVNGCFSSLNFLEWDNTTRFVEHSEQQTLMFVYAYSLFKSWEDNFPEKMEITMIDLENFIGLSYTFGLNERELNDVLDSLSGEGVLYVNRQLFPATIIRTASAASMIPMLYSRIL